MGPSGGHPWRRIYFLVKQTGRSSFYRHRGASYDRNRGIPPTDAADGTQRQDRRGVVVDFLVKQTGRQRLCPAEDRLLSVIRDGVDQERQADSA